MNQGTMSRKNNPGKTYIIMIRLFINLLFKFSIIELSNCGGGGTKIILPSIKIV